VAKDFASLGRSNSPTVSLPFMVAGINLEVSWLWHHCQRWGDPFKEHALMRTSFFPTQFCRTTRHFRNPKQQNSCSLELLERRLALTADTGTLSRPPLEQTDSVYLDNSLIGPPPIIMNKSEIIGDETNSFVITSVANGVVEKWLPATGSWVNVSAVPTTSNPMELLTLLRLRLIQQGDRIQWTPSQSTSPLDFDKAFDVVGWDDGNPITPPSSEAPSEVQNLRFGQSEDATSLMVSWDPPAAFVGSLNYTVTIDNGSTNTTYITTSTSKNFSDLETGVPYTFWVWATNTDPHALKPATGPTSSISAAPSKDQTPTFSQVTNWSGDYDLTFAEYDMGTASVPTLQSFASGIYDDQWVLVAGRTNGLHGFSDDGLANFPPRYQNTDVWVIDPISKETWSRSLNDTSSGLSSSEIDSLSSTNTESYQDGNTLFIVGGYVYSRAKNNFTTYNALSAIDLPTLVNWVKGTDETLHTNAILQVAGEESSDNSYDGGFFQVTGGGLEKIEDRYQLVFGQKFEGPYAHGSTTFQVYTSQVRSFDIDYDFVNGSLSYSTDSNMINPSGGDPSRFRRRDLNVFPILSPDGQGGTTKSTVALAGVFYNGVGVWTVPVEIGYDGVPTTENPTNDPDVFRQAMNQYESGKIGLYSQTSGEMTQVLLGGISANTFDPATEQLTYDENNGFHRQITAVLRDASGTYQQQYITDFPDVYDGNGKLLYFGANARFFPAKNVPVLTDGVINLDSLSTETVIGYMFGGIAADQPNFGTTVASSIIFEVTYAPQSD